jgi:hypothetical protein
MKESDEGIFGSIIKGFIEKMERRLRCIGRRVGVERRKGWKGKGEGRKR